MVDGEMQGDVLVLRIDCSEVARELFPSVCIPSALN